MRVHRLTFVALALCAGAAPGATPFADGDAAAGKTLSDRDCVACHARQFEGDAARIYTRTDRRVHNPEQLLAQVRYCNAQIGTGYFPDEEAHIAAYLNKQYYHFQ
ncbi:MAG: cytochrome c [Casimicrobiaceae bacterium]